MKKIETISALLKEPLASRGYEILQLRYIKSQRSRLEILLERLDEAPVTIEDCTQASRLIAVLLDVEDPIPGAYVLEVSSPGLDRPQLRLRDYERFKGGAVTLECVTPLEGQKCFKARIQDLEGDRVVFLIERSGTAIQESLSLRLEEIARCKLLPVL